MTQVIDAPAVEVKPVETLNEMMLLCEAADLIKRRGWVQGSFNSGWRYCAVGALRATTRRHFGSWHNGLYEMACGRLQRVILRYYPEVQSSIEDWNDAPGRTREEVLQMLRLAGDCATEV